jgi:predicted esterase
MIINYIVTNMNFNLLKKTISICLLILFIYKLLSIVSHKMIFLPYRSKKGCKICDDDKFISIKITTPDGEILDCGLYNAYRKPSFDDSIFLYSHGNRGWLDTILRNTTIEMLSNYGSIFVYDYRGYGKSTGVPSDEGLFIDAISCWNYLTTHLKVKPSNIILFGYSLGSSVSSNLLKQIIDQNDNKDNLPRALILQNGFYNMRHIAHEIIPYIGHLIISKFHTDQFIKEIDDKIKDYKIIIFHSIDDEYIGSHHGEMLHSIIKNNKGQYIKINGDHANPVFNNNSDQVIKSIIEKVNN